MSRSDELGKGLDDLKIDRTKRRPEGGSRWPQIWIVVGIVLLLGLALWVPVFSGGGEVEVELYRVQANVSGASGDPVVLEAAGYIVPHHRIEVASKVVGRVAWIGVEKGDKVERGQVLVRLEDHEYRAQVLQADGNLASLKANLAELNAGSRPEQIELTRANLEEAKADLAKAALDIERAKELSEAGVISVKDYDDAKASYAAQQARVQSLDRAFELTRLGPRQEQIDSAVGQVRQAEGRLDFAKTQLDATIIRAPVAGTILERNVEVGEYVTTGFVGDRGAKGYVVSLADLNDIQVELDISQDDFAKTSFGQKAILKTDAYRDREYEGEIVEISPEADRQKATVQVKVQILHPDDYLRPEMNANVAFLGEKQDRPEAAAAQATITIPAAALRNGSEAFVFLDGKAVLRKLEAGRTSSRGVEIVSGLYGGEDLILSPPEDLEDGDPVRKKPS